LFVMNNHVYTLKKGPFFHRVMPAMRRDSLMHGSV
jgi:hypothetical protein